MDCGKKSFRIVIGWALAALLSLLSSGCVFFDSELDLNYSPSGKGPIREIPARTVFLEVMDLRPEWEHGRVGKVRNLSNAHTADFLSKEPIVDEIYHALAAELEAAGHRVVDSVEQAQVRVFFKIEHIDTRVNMLAWDVELTSEIEGDVSVANPPGSLHPISFSVSAVDVERYPMVLDSDREEALNRALAQLVQAIFSDHQFFNGMSGPTAAADAG